MEMIGDKLHRTVEHNRRTLIICSLVTLAVFAMMMFAFLVYRYTDCWMWSTSYPATTYPFVAFLSFNLNNSGSRNCVGTLIHRRYILTAGHCLANATNVRIILGTSNFLDKQRVLVFSNKFIRHKYYNNHNFDNDIGIIELDHDIEINDKINIIALNSLYEIDHPKDSGVVLGWGLNSSMGLSEELLIKNVNIVDNEECFSYFAQGNIVFNNLKTICTLSEEGPCHSDSGGPLIWKNVQIGVISAGEKECRPKTPVRYMNISYYRKWIQNQIDDRT